MLDARPRPRTVLSAVAALVAVLPVACGARSTLDHAAAGSGGAPGGSSASSGGAPSGPSASSSANSASTTSGGGGASASASTGVQIVCAPGEVVSCYNGPAATLGVGPCHAGTQTCLPDGSGFAACAGQTVPAFEDCLTPEDEDCNGTSAACTPGFTLLGAAHDVYPTGMAIDLAGGVILLGVLAGTADLGGGTVVSSGAAVDFVLVRYDVEGHLLWSRHFPTSATVASAVGGVSLAGEDIVIAGAVNGTVDLGAGPVPGDGGFVARLDATGNLVWMARDHDSGLRVAVDAVGDTYVASYCRSSTAKICEEGGTIKKLDPAGHLLWQLAVTDKARVRPFGVGVDSHGNLLVGGIASGTFDVGLGPMPGAGMFLAKIDGTGKALWARAFTDTAQGPAFETLEPSDYGNPWAKSGVESDSTLDLYSLTVAPNDDVIFTGKMLESVDLGGGALTSGIGGLLHARFDGDGKHVWSKSFGSGISDAPPAVAMVPSGGLVTVAYTRFPKPANPLVGGLDFGGGTLPPGLALARLTASGQPITSQSFPSGGQRSWLFVGATPNAVYVAGNASPDITIGAAKGSGMFLARLIPGG